MDNTKVMKVLKELMMKDRKVALTAPLPDRSRDKDGKNIGRKIDLEMYKELDVVDQEMQVKLSSEPPFSRTCGVDLAAPGKEFTVYHIMRNGKMEILDLRDAKTQDKLYWINRFRMARLQLEEEGHPGADAFTKLRQGEIDGLKAVEIDLMTSLETVPGRVMKAVTAKDIDLDKETIADAIENSQIGIQPSEPWPRVEQVDEESDSSFRRSEAQTTNYREVYGDRPREMYRKKRPIFDFFANWGERLGKIFTG